MAGGVRESSIVRGCGVPRRVTGGILVTVSNSIQLNI